MGVTEERGIFISFRKICPSQIFFLIFFQQFEIVGIVVVLPVVAEHCARPGWLNRADPKGRCRIFDFMKFTHGKATIRFFSTASETYTMKVHIRDEPNMVRSVVANWQHLNQISCGQSLFSSMMLQNFFRIRMRVRVAQHMWNTAARRSTPGCVKRNLKNFNKKAPELKLVGYPFLYIPVDIPPVSPRRGLR